MDIERAIDILNDPEADMVYTVEEIDLACLVAIDALKKQIAILPNFEGPTNDAKDDAEAYCPVCDYYFKDETSYCPDCGQKLDW